MLQPDIVYNIDLWFQFIKELDVCEVVFTLLIL
jgi:hypothetical protein